MNENLDRYRYQANWSAITMLRYANESELNVYNTEKG